MINNLFFLLVFCCVQYAYGTTIVARSESEFLKLEDDVVVGEVVFVARPTGFLFWDSCFTQQYKMKVVESFKNKISVGEIIDLGFPIPSGLIAVGDRQLAVISRYDEVVAKKYGPSCHFDSEGGVFDKRRMFVPRINPLSFYSVGVSSKGEKIVIAYNCMESITVAYQDYFRLVGRVDNVKIGDKSCGYFTAPYDGLIRRIVDDLRDAESS